MVLVPSQCRTRTFDRADGPSLIVPTLTHILTLRVVAAYRHLGARFLMDADLEQEITARIGSARQAFEEVKRQIFLNKAIPVKGRVQLYSSLILSRLFYGCSTWADVTSSQLRRLEAMITGHYRRIYDEGFWQQTQSSDRDFCLRHQLQSFRVHWARHRLMFLQHIARHGHPYHWQLLLAEFCHGQGWLHEVRDDLRWMSHFHSLPFDIPEDAETWLRTKATLAGLSAWKSMVKQSCVKHSPSFTSMW